MSQSLSTASAASVERNALPSVAEALRLAGVFLQLAVVVYLVRRLKIQDAAFFELCLATLVAFPIHALLPLRLRQPCFLIYSFAAIFLVLGAANAAALVAIGLALIGICHLRLPEAARISLLVAAGALLAALRVGWLPSPVSAAIWPVLGSMFMFRLALFLYDRRHEKGPVPLTRVLSYFFMAPNVCFPLFPVIDFKRFGRNYYDQEAARIYQRGVHWVFRGVVHLLAYRAVYQYFVLPPDAVASLGDMLHYSLALFLLYLRVSGTFHLIIGMLLLFGFNLPETHHLYYLASSFTDFWRRINIYWKDFMMKLVYYPAHFRLRRFGETQALVGATLVVFVATWALHAWQWFWLRGSALLEWHDALFWGVLAVLVIANSLWESRHGRARSIGRRAPSRAELAATALSTAATFSTICLLWGMWSGESFGQWISLWRATGDGWVVVALAIPALYAGAWLARRLPQRPRLAARTVRPATPAFWRSAAPNAIGIALLFVVSTRPVYSHFPGRLGTMVEAIRFPELNRADIGRIEQGYYEQLIGGNRHNAELWQVYNDMPPDWETRHHIRDTSDYLKWQVLPSVALPFKGKIVQTNEWGMRDRSYARVPPAGSVRVAVLGASTVFGEGVANDETFESLIEERANREGCGEAGVRYELLNFGAPSRDAAQQVLVYEKQALDFQPDVLLYIAHARIDLERANTNLRDAIRAGVEIPFPYLRSVVERAGVTSNMTNYALVERLKPFEAEIVFESYRRLEADSREHGVLPVWALVPLTYQRFKPADVESEVALARRAGFETMTLLDVFDGIDPDALAVAPWDRHPNERGHQLIAERMYRLLCSEQENLSPRLRAALSGASLRAANQP